MKKSIRQDSSHIFFYAEGYAGKIKKRRVVTSKNNFPKEFVRTNVLIANAVFKERMDKTVPENEQMRKL